MIKKDSIYRLYCISLYQLCYKHAGVQNNHSTEAMYLHLYDDMKSFGIIDSRKEDQTAIFLSGGTSQMLTEQINKLKDLKYPFFKEFKEPDLYNQVTSYSLFIPDYIVKSFIPENEDNLSMDEYYEYTYPIHGLSRYEFDLKVIINGLKLL